MFDVSFPELAVIAVIALIVLGPERLPTAARTLGRWVGRAKGYMRNLSSELEREMSLDEIRSEVREARERIESETRSTFEPMMKPIEPGEADPSIEADVARETTPGEARDGPGGDPDRPEAPVTEGSDDRPSRSEPHGTTVGRE
jgi:sec-independent protein translocase protein TatB